MSKTKPFKLRAFKITNLAIDVKGTSIKNLLCQKLSGSLAKNRRLLINPKDPAQEEDLISDFILEPSKYVTGAMLRIRPSDDIKDIPDNTDKIYIKEIWGSSRFFKRASTYNKLEDGALAFNTEMRRRYELHKEHKKIQEEGNRIIILGESEDDKTDHVEDIVYKIGESIHMLNNRNLASKIDINILGPIEQQKNEADELYRRKNRGSVILQINIKESYYTNQILLTGDAGADVLEYMHDIYQKELNKFKYDILQAPHHCSKYSMFNKISEDECELSGKAYKMLSQVNPGAKIIASCTNFDKTSSLPPHEEARKKYEDIVGKDKFLYTLGYENGSEPIEFELTGWGHKEIVKASKAKMTTASAISVGEARGHG